MNVRYTPWPVFGLSALLALAALSAPGLAQPKDKDKQEKLPRAPIPGKIALGERLDKLRDVYHDGFAESQTDASPRQQLLTTWFKEAADPDLFGRTATPCCTWPWNCPPSTASSTPNNRAISGIQRHFKIRTQTWLWRRRRCSPGRPTQPNSATSSARCSRRYHCILEKESNT